ncbi:MAG: four helix bundle protein [bacterium]
MKTNQQFKEELEERVLVFAANVVNLLATLPQLEVLKIVVYQLAKSSTSMGANYSEANHPESRADFIHKISVVVKESKESLFWLKFINRLNCLSVDIKSRFQPLAQEADELLRIFTTVQRTARENEKKT